MVPLTRTQIMHNSEFSVRDYAPLAAVQGGIRYSSGKIWFGKNKWFAGLQAIVVFNKYRLTFERDLWGFMPYRSIGDPKNIHFRHQMLQTDSVMEMTYSDWARKSEGDGGASSCLNISIEDAGNLLRTLSSIRDGGQRSGRATPQRNHINISLLLSNRASVSIFYNAKWMRPHDNECRTVASSTTFYFLFVRSYIINYLFSMQIKINRWQLVERESCVHWTCIQDDVETSLGLVKLDGG